MAGSMMHEDRISAAPYLGSSTFLSGMVNYVPETDHSHIRAVIMDKLVYMASDKSSTATLTPNNVDQHHVEVDCHTNKQLIESEKSRPNQGIFYLGGSQDDPDDMYSDTGKV